MEHKQFLSRSLFRETEATIASDLIYDEIYKNASSKNKYSRNPKYVYYNALLTMKQKMSEQQAPVFDSLFNSQPRRSSPLSSHPESPSAPRKTLMPIYHVQKINKMKFKVYKQNGPIQFVDKLPITDLSFQIKIKGEQAQTNAKPRLEQILNEYRKINMNNRHSNSRGGQIHRSSIGQGSSDLNIKVMRSTWSKIGRSVTTHRK